MEVFHKPGEMAARAVSRIDTIDYPKSKSGEARAQKYVEDNWERIAAKIAPSYQKWRDKNSVT